MKFVNAGGRSANRRANELRVPLELQISLWRDVPRFNDGTGGVARTSNAVLVALVSEIAIPRAGVVASGLRSLPPDDAVGSPPSFLECFPGVHAA